MGKASTFPPQLFKLLPELKSPAIFIMHYVLPNVISQLLAFTENLELNHFKGWGKEKHIKVEHIKVEPVCTSFCTFHLTITELKKNHTKKGNKHSSIYFHIHWSKQYIISPP